MIKWHEVTWYSKLGAVILLFIILPGISFYIGIKYQEVKYEAEREQFLDQLLVTRFTQKNQQKDKVVMGKISPTGLDGNYTKEDAIRATELYDLWTRTATGNSPRYHAEAMALVPAINTGNGMAWFVEDDDDNNILGKQCPKPKNYIHVTFEMNQVTGVIDVKRECRFAIFD